MNSRIICASLLAVVLGTAQATADEGQRPKLQPPSTVSVYAETPSFGEGVVFDQQGRLFVSQPFTGQVLLIEPDGSSSVWTDAIVTPNGHKVLPDGRHVVMDRGPTDVEEDVGSVAYLSSEGTLLARLESDEYNRRLRAPNDLVLDPNGGFWFTDPGRFMQNEPGRIYRVNANGEIRTASDGIVDFPNGIALSPAGDRLFVCESGTNRILVFPISDIGELGAPEALIELPSFPNAWTNSEAEPDGMALGPDGNLHVAHFGAGVVHVVSMEGELLGSYTSGSSSVTNLAFSSAGDLYVFGSSGHRLGEIANGGRLMRLEFE